MDLFVMGGVVALGAFALYLIELICRLMQLPAHLIPSALVAEAASRLFRTCSELSYECLDMCRRAWEYLLRLRLWRQMLESLGIFTRVLELILSPMGLMFGAIRYFAGRLAHWTGSAIPQDVWRSISNIGSVRDWFFSYCRSDGLRYLLMPSVYCCVLFGLGSAFLLMWLWPKAMTLIQRSP